MRPWMVLALASLLCGCPQVAEGPTERERPDPAVVTSSPALAEMVFAIDAGPHLVGVSSYCQHPPQVKDLPRIGGLVDPNLEAIESLAPDLILQQGKSEALTNLAERRDYRLELFQIDTIAEVLDALTRLGALLGKRTAAKREVERLQAALERARSRRPQKPPRVLLVFGHKPGELGQISSPGVGTFLSECLTAVGGESCLANLPARSYHLVAKEVLVDEAQAPDLIIELRTEPTDAETARQLRADWAVLSTVPAVRNERIAIVSGDEILLPGPRLDQVLDKLSRAVNGEMDVD